MSTFDGFFVRVSCDAVENHLKMSLAGFVVFGDRAAAFCRGIEASPERVKGRVVSL
jgi:hypothetical protein